MHLVLFCFDIILSNIWNLWVNDLIIIVCIIFMLRKNLFVNNLLNFNFFLIFNNFFTFFMLNFSRLRNLIYYLLINISWELHLFMIFDMTLILIEVFLVCIYIIRLFFSFFLKYLKIKWFLRLVLHILISFVASLINHFFDNAGG